MLEHLTPENNIFKDATVAIIGDLMLDTFIYGTVDRISPEAPIPVVKISHRTNTLGGAGNVAANLASIGATPILIGRIGSDEAKNSFFTICTKNNINTSNIVISSEPTTSKSRIVAQNQQIVRIDEELNTELNDITRAQIIEKLKAVRELADVIIVSDYAKGVIDQPMLETIKTLWESGSIIVDPKPRKTINYTGITSMTPNLAEAKILLGEETIATTNQQAERIAQALLDKFNLNSLMFTRSADGITTHNGQNIEHFPTQVQEVRDVSGAGDTVISILAAGTSCGLKLEDIAEIANIAGKIVVSKAGTASLTWPEILEAMKSSNKYPPYMFR